MAERNIIKPRRGSTVPTTNDLEVGEFSIDHENQIIYGRGVDGVIRVLASAGGSPFKKFKIADASGDDEALAKGQFRKYLGRNFIRNSGMVMAQRGTSQTSQGYGSLDGWTLLENVENVTISQLNGKAMHIVNNSGQEITVRQFIEDFYAIANNRYVSIAASVKCNAGSVNIDCTDRFNKSTDLNYWHRIESSGKSSLNDAYAPNGWFDISVPDGGDIEISEVQVELSPFATEYQIRTIQEEQLLNYRYYWRSTQDFYLKMFCTGGFKGIQFARPVPMRIEPTETFDINTGQLHFNGSDEFQIHIGLKEQVDTAHNIIQNYTASAEI